MAKFSVNGFDTISASFEQIAQLSDDDKFSVVAPAAEILKNKFVEKIKAVFTQRSSVLAESITVQRKVGDDGAYAHIIPKGKHPASRTGKRDRKPKSNDPYSGTNAEVAYILEYGSPRIRGRHWMEETVEESEEEVLEAQQAAWNDLLTRKGL